MDTDGLTLRLFGASHDPSLATSYSCEAASLVSPLVMGCSLHNICRGVRQTLGYSAGRAAITSRLLVSQSFHRVHEGGTAGRQECGEQRQAHHCRNDEHDRDRALNLDVLDETGG